MELAEETLAADGREKLTPESDAYDAGEPACAAPETQVWELSAPEKTDPPQAAEKEPYLFSVRFFKNMILLAVIAAILIPVGIAAYQGRERRQTEESAAQLKSQLDALQSRYDALDAETKAKEQIWGGSVADRVVSAEALDYQKLYPDFYVKEPIGKSVQDDKTMYLTFDDGPSSSTPELLSILKEEDVKATFFVVGGDTERQREWMRDIADAGHTLGLHSYTHNYHTIYASVEAFLDDYYHLFTNIKEATGQTPKIFRFPGGSVNSYNHPVYREIIAEMLRRGFVFYDWNLSSGDASGNYISPSRIEGNVLNNAAQYARGIVLFHDSETKESTVEALPDVIAGLREQGYQFAALSREVRPILFNYIDYQPE